MPKVKLAYKDIVSLFFIFFISLISILPLVKTNQHMDYDSGSITSLAVHLLEKPQGYVPTRHPGSPVFELGVAALCKIFTIFGATTEAAWGRILQWMNWFLFMGFMAIFYFDAKKATNRVTGLLMSLCLVLHPLFLWSGWALVDDIPALFFGYLGWRLVYKGKNLEWAALAVAVAINCKAFALAYFIASLANLIAQKNHRRLARFTAMTILLSGLFYLPAFAAFQFSLKQALTTENYGSVLSYRPIVGWALIRQTVLIHLPLLVWLLGVYSARLWKKQTTLAHFADPLIGLIVIWGFILFNEFHFDMIVGLTMFATFWTAAHHQDKQTRELFFSSILPLSLAVLVVTALMLTSPYSRSFFLLALPPLLLLVGHRVSSRYFWFATVIIGFVPMFHYFQIGAHYPKILVFEHGFYDALIKQHAREYNDTGIYNTPAIFVYPDKPPQ